MSCAIPPAPCSSDRGDGGCRVNWPIRAGARTMPTPATAKPRSAASAPSPRCRSTRLPRIARPSLKSFRTTATNTTGCDHTLARTSAPAPPGLFDAYSERPHQVDLSSTNGRTASLGMGSIDARPTHPRLPRSVLACRGPRRAGSDKRLGGAWLAEVLPGERPADWLSIAEARPKVVSKKGSPVGQEAGRTINPRARWPRGGGS